MRTALLLIDHGSKRQEANETLHCMARMVQYLAGDDIVVRCAHMELATPTISEAFAECVGGGADEVVVLPYMLAPGRHANDDIPRLVAEAAATHGDIRYRITPPLGAHPLLAQLVLARCDVAPHRVLETEPGPQCPTDSERCDSVWCRPR